MQSDSSKTFKDRLIQEISFNGYTNKEFAAQLEISINTLNMYLYRNSIPSADLAVKMARVLGTTTEYLFSETTDENKKLSSNKNQKRTKEKEIQKIIELFSEEELSAFLDITKAFYKVTITKGKTHHN